MARLLDFRSKGIETLLFFFIIVESGLGIYTLVPVGTLSRLVGCCFAY
jgi:hypothetical protein